MSYNDTFRVFISSTFNDLKIERDVLQNEVFPKVKEYCLEKGFKFDVIDLRWGVNNEASLDHKAMKICIDEVKRSVNHPRPNFIVLLGDRYGWIPLKTEIEENYFKTILKHIKNISDKLLVEKWYKLDANALNPSYILQAVDSIYESTNFVELSSHWREDERKLLTIFQETIRDNSLKKDLFFTSATEQEIIHGVFNIEGENNVLVLNRKLENIEDYKESSEITTYIDTNVDEAKLKLELLKKRLEEDVKDSFFTFQTTLAHNKDRKLVVNRHFLNSYVEATIQFLKNNIDSEIVRIQNLKTEELEETYHANFLAERANAFVGRETIIESVSEYITKPNTYAYVLHGESGVGKSALMAKIISMQTKRNIIYRFIGISEKSSMPLSLLNDLVIAIESKINIAHTTPIQEYDNVVNRFIELLYLASKKDGITIFIDALDQFGEENRLEWLDEKLPKNVKIIVSTLPGFYYEQLQRKVPKCNFKNISPLKIKDGEKILQTWFRENRRTLTKEQYRYILEKFSNNGLPLYLRIAFEEAMQWHSYTKKVHLNSTLVGVIREFIENLILKKYHSEELVEHVLGYLSASKNGLSEDELFEILSLDIVVMQDISNPYHRLPISKNFAKLPAAIWTRFYYDIVQYLSVTSKDNQVLLSFYHRKISETVRDYYYTPDKNIFHMKLAEYFIVQAAYLDDRTINMRKSSELPYQLLHANLFSQFVKMYNVEFLGLKSAQNQIVQALNELNEAYVKIESANLVDEVKERLLSSLAKTLLAYLLVKVQTTDSTVLSVENIHAVYVYGINRNYYDRVLKYASSLESLEEIYLNGVKGNVEVDKEVLLRYYVAFKARYSNKIRRDADLKRSFEIYLELLKIIDESSLNNKADLNELSKIEYDMGYIKYLEGDFHQAIEFMHKSVLSATDAEQYISAAISRCVEYRIRFLAGQSDVEEFDKVLDESYALFYDNRLKSPSAKRWVTNVLAHKFETAYENRNLQEAQKYHKLLLNDTWRSEFKTKNESEINSPDNARVCILEDNYKKACEIFEVYIFKSMGTLELRKKRESVSREYFDYLIALKGMGNFTRLKEVLIELLNEIPLEPGNHRWKQLASKVFYKYI